MGKETGDGRQRGENEGYETLAGGGGGGGGEGEGGLRPKDEAVEEGEVDEMHQLPRSSLAAASIPSAKGSFFLSPSNNHHHHHNDHHQLSVKEQNQTTSSPINSRVSSRAAASLKQRAVEQKMPGGGTTRPPLQFAVSSTAQLARPVATPARSANHVSQAEEQDAASHFQGGGRPAGSPSPATSVAHAGFRPQVSVANHAVHVKGLAENSELRTSSHRPMSRSASPGVLQQPSDEITQHGQSVPFGAALPAGTLHPQVLQSPKLTRSQALHQQQVTSSTIATQYSSSQVSSAVRSPASGSKMGNNNDVLLRDRSMDSSILVKVCDRKVRLSSEQDPTSLYALCRRWVRNDLPRADQAQLWEQPPLPRPLTPVEAEKAESEVMENGNKREGFGLSVEAELSEPVDSMSEKELLQHHVEHFKTLRKRCREDRMRRVARFKQRLALLLPANNDSGRRDSLSDPSHHP